MKIRRIRVIRVLSLLSAVLVLAAAALACDLPAIPGVQTQQLDQAGTSVALTLSALSSLTAPATSVPATPPPSAAAPSDLLPHSLYFLNKDSAGLMQVFRVAKDGLTFQQITFEPAAVNTYDVSAVDGSVVYGSNNQLLLVDANGAGRRLLVDGGPVDDNNRFTNSVGSPVWSPDGKMIAFSHGGLKFFAVDTGAVTQVLENKIDMSAGFPIVGELYGPIKYSPDGSRLLLSIAFNEAGTFGIYRPSDNTLVRFNKPEGGLICCDIRWVPDGSGLYAASPTLGMVDSGLAYVDASTGLVSTLLPGSAPDGTYNFALGPAVGPDGKLYFFFNNLPQIPVEGHTPLYMVRSDTDGNTGRTELQPSVFQNINEILWAPDTSFALMASVAASAATPGVFEGGQLQIVYSDARPSIILTQSGEQMKWGP